MYKQSSDNLILCLIVYFQGTNFQREKGGKRLSSQFLNLKNMCLIIEILKGNFFINFSLDLQLLNMF
ncbi:hypothetical protein IC582_016554 [Cucumis melo]